MSNPNSQNVGISPGLSSNEKVLQLREILRKKLPKKIDFADKADDLCRYLFSYAVDQQIDGNFSAPAYRLASVQWTVLKRACPWLPLEESEAAIVWEAFSAVGILKDNKIPHFRLFNAHVVNHKKNKKQRQEAGKISAQLRKQRQERELAGDDKPDKPTEQPAKKQPKAPRPNPVARVIALKQILENHPGKPNAANAPTDRDALKLQRSEFRILEAELNRLNTEIVGIGKAA